MVRGCAEKHAIITESASSFDKMPQKNQRRTGFFWLTVSEDLVHRCVVPSHGTVVRVRVSVSAREGVVEELLDSGQPETTRGGAWDKA